jgi:hypothetical protein
MNASSDDARAAAERLIRSGFVEDRELLETATIADPLPVRAPGGAAAGWLVPLIAGGRLCSFFQFDARLTLLRYSAFPKGRCPESRSWLDPDAIAAVALEKFPGASRDAAPFLTYDRDPSRIAWAVPVRDENGQRVIYVTGDYAYIST